MQPLTPMQTQVLSGLLSGQPIAAVARDNGIDRSTIYHWRKDHPHFTFALDQARARLQAALYDDVQDLVSQALQVLAELLHSTDDKIRLRVAQTLLRAANPMKANTILHTNVGFENLSDHADGLRAMTALANAGTPESNTIQPSPTPNHASPSAPPQRMPNRNQRCPCNSGIKYKKCCGIQRSPRPQQSFGAAAEPGLIPAGSFESHNIQAQANT